jgi:hypothetical protein
MSSLWIYVFILMESAIQKHFVFFFSFVVIFVEK